jgi:formylglycine-generating enzyme required for sulfatase activity/tRNA A-37 threonylcarbamoyl transferase component Bud32
MNPPNVNDPLSESDAKTLAPDPALAAPDATASPAVVVPGYEVLEELGRGGMAVVYKARDRRLGRLVALKMILAGAHASPAERARFRAEAEAIARVQHPDIVQIYEVGEHADLPFLSLEFCPGGTLEQELAGTPLAAREAAAVLERLARAVAAAHAVGVIHRDLKPANVLRAVGGTPKITDFGLAKREGVSGQTASGAVLGTPSYMAPEQAAGKGQQVGPAADVYALGAILYELLTGRPPFKAATPLDTLLQVVQDEPVPVRALQPKVPRDLETICLKCLQKEPRKRYRGAALLAEDLRRFLTGEPIQARPVGRLERAVKWVKRNPVVTAATLAVVLALTLGTTVTYLKYLDAEQQKRIAQEKETEARQETEKTRKARDFLASMFRLSAEDLEAGGDSARRVLEDAEQRIPVQFADQPEFRDALLADIRRVRLAATGKTPYALLLEVRGTVALQSASGATKPADPQALLYAGDRLRLAADAQAQLVFLSDLHKERLKAAREVTVRRKGCEPADAIRERDNSILMTFARLPKGAFYMGGGGGKAGKKTEIPEDFEIAVHDVTQGQWEAVMGNNPSYFSRKGGGRTAVRDISDEELKLFPVETVSWNDTQEFLKRLNEKERNSGYLYRLPTEAEWEYACRGGASSEEECSYHFYFEKPTNDLSSEQANFDGNFPFGKAPKGKYLERTTRVGAYPSNKLGLRDMHGNVWQWTSSSEGSGRVSRGGGWSNGGSVCRAAYRSWSAPTDRYSDLGFRLARVPVR